MISLGQYEYRRNTQLRTTKGKLLWHSWMRPIVFGRYRRAFEALKINYTTPGILLTINFDPLHFQIDQINREYKIRALKLHPDKNPDPKSLERFRQLQTAKDVLIDQSSRRSYDCWLNSGINIPFEQWQSKKGHSMHWASPRPSKLSIKENSSIGQGSDFKINNEGLDRDPERSLLEKFRKYEI